MDKKRDLVHCRRESYLHECPSFCPFKDEAELINHFHGDRDPPTVVKRYYLLCQACELEQSGEGRVTSLLTKFVVLLLALYRRPDRPAAAGMAPSPRAPATAASTSPSGSRRPKPS